LIAQQIILYRRKAEDGFPQPEMDVYIKIIIGCAEKTS